jgi:hypothetical protein
MFLPLIAAYLFGVPLSTLATGTFLVEFPDLALLFVISGVLFAAIAGCAIGLFFFCIVLCQCCAICCSQPRRDPIRGEHLFGLLLCLQ